MINSLLENINSCLIFQYNWTVKSDNGSEVKVGHFQGKHLHIPPGRLHGGDRYKITCNLYHKTQSKLIGSVSIQ